MGEVRTQLSHHRLGGFEMFRRATGHYRQLANQRLRRTARQRRIHPGQSPRSRIRCQSLCRGRVDRGHVDNHRAFAGSLGDALRSKDRSADNGRGIQRCDDKVLARRRIRRRCSGLGAFGHHCRDGICVQIEHCQVKAHFCQPGANRAAHGAASDESNLGHVISSQAGCHPAIDEQSLPIDEGRSRR